MIQVEQQLLADAEHGVVGDCWKCCIASVLDLEYEVVPHFYQDEFDAEARGKWYSGWNATLDFLRPFGLTLTSFGLWGTDEPCLDYGGKGEKIAREQGIRYHFSAPGYWIASVVSPRCTELDGSHGSHAVVMHGHKIAWDPHPLREMGHLGFTSAYLLSVGPTPPAPPRP